MWKDEDGWIHIEYESEYPEIERKEASDTASIPFQTKDGKIIWKQNVTK